MSSQWRFNLKSEVRLRRRAAATEFGQHKNRRLEANSFDPEINPRSAGFCRRHRFRVEVLAAIDLGEVSQENI